MNFSPEKEHGILLHLAFMVDILNTSSETSAILD